MSCRLPFHSAKTPNRFDTIRWSMETTASYIK